MAKLSDLPPELHSTAKRIPADILDRLTAEEALHRCAYCADYESRVPVTGELTSAMMSRSRRILRSLPVREAIERYNDLYRMSLEMPGGNGVDSPAHELRARAHKLKNEENAYPPDLWRQAEKHLDGKSSYYPDVNLDDLLVIDAAEKAVKKAELPFRIVQYRAALYHQYLVAGMKPPFELD